MAKKSTRFWITLLAILAIGVLGGFAYLKGKKKPKGIAIQTEKVITRTLKETVTGSGRIFPEKEIKISSDVSGEIVKLYVLEGDSVVTGQVLAKIDPEAYESTVERGRASLNNAKAQEAMSKSQIQSAEAQMQQINAQLENARTIHERNTGLLSEGVISKAEFEQSLSNLRGLEANLKAAQASKKSSEESAKGAAFNIQSAQASLKELRTSLNRTTIKAPGSGIISSLSVEQGERVVGTIQMTGTEMMRIANLNTMEVQVDVSENDILKVQIGQEADVEVDAYLDQKFKGVVTEIANSASNVSSAAQSLNTDQVTNFIVKIRLDPNSYKELTQRIKYPFRPGMSSSVDIYTHSEEDALTIPIQSVTTRNKDKEDKDGELMEVVFIHQADTVAMQEIVTGIQNDEYIHIISGLEEDQEIVSGPYSAISKKLEDGENVRIKEKKEDKKE